MGKIRNHVVLAGTVLAFAASGASAQYINDPSMVEAKGKKQRAVQDAWVALPPKMKMCMDQALAKSQISFEYVIREKLPPHDPRFASQMNRCERIASRELQRNFPCTISENGYPVETMCDEVYANVEGRQPLVLTYQQYVAADLLAKKVDVIEVESPPARDARMNGQRPYR